MELGKKENGKRKLYRIPNQAKVCGVCAGLAEYFGFEVWVVRIITVSLLVLNWFNGTIALAYFVLYFVLDPKPGCQKVKGYKPLEPEKTNKSYENQEDKVYRSSVKEVWRNGTTPKELMERIESKFSFAEAKLQNIESFVTSNQFELEREFNKIK